jgi:ABC-type transporter Mla MlaB component
VALGSALTIAEAGSCWRELRAMLARGGARVATVDAHALRSVDTAGLQLLLVAGRAARERGLTLRLAGATQLLSDTAEALGLAADLACCVELTA